MSRTITANRAGPYQNPAYAAATREEWLKAAQDEGQRNYGTNANKVILSLFDTTGVWSQPWRDAGYDVITFDIQDGMDINDLCAEYFMENWNICEVYGVLAACPCTDFSSSGAQYWGAKDLDGRTDASVELVMQTMRVIEFFDPTFWVIENPVGRIEKLCGLPPARMSFDPHHFGDAHTKRTLLWGEFNDQLPTANVEPVLGSKMLKAGGKSLATKNMRSETPEGFAYAFFMANHDLAIKPINDDDDDDDEVPPMKEKTLSKKSQVALDKYGPEVCAQAYRMNELEGEGASTIGINLGLTTRQADSAINAHREVHELKRKKANRRARADSPPQTAAARQRKSTQAKYDAGMVRVPTSAGWVHEDDLEEAKAYLAGLRAKRGL